LYVGGSCQYTDYIDAFHIVLWSSVAVILTLIAVIGSLINLGGSMGGTAGGTSSGTSGSFGAMDPKWMSGRPWLGFLAIEHNPLEDRTMLTGNNCNTNHMDFDNNDYELFSLKDKEV
jgi:hypothetical protein